MAGRVRTVCFEPTFSWPKVYRFLSEGMAFPSVSFFKTWLSSISMTSGIISYVADALKKTTKNMQLPDRACALIFDEMSLKENLQYDQKNNLSLGYSHNGK